jgi:hypothetical protein
MEDGFEVPAVGRELEAFAGVTIREIDSLNIPDAHQLAH